MQKQCSQLVSDGRGHGVSHTCALGNTGWHAKKVSQCNKTDSNPTVKLYIYILNYIVVILK